MADKPIQEEFGQVLIDAIIKFARTDLETVDELEADKFSHVRDAALRRALAEVFYGCRWIYKVGLALLTRDAERAAHVRSQLLDYGSVAETLLSYCIGHAIRGAHTRGTSYTFRDPDKQQQPIAWNTADPVPQLQKQSFWWLIRIAGDFGIIDATTQSGATRLRNLRNIVHLRRAATGPRAYLNEAQRAYMTVLAVLQQTKRWCVKHP